MIIRLLLSSVLASLVVAQAQKGGAINPQLVGTWTTKSRVVFTGPGFYDPVKDKMTEPPLTGISYSFTADGHFEEAYYRTGDNGGSTNRHHILERSILTSLAQNPKCPQGIIQWQHGTFTQNANGSLSLTPIAVDGRQQKSNPCAYQQSLYTRYHQTELFSVRRSPLPLSDSLGTITLTYRRCRNSTSARTPTTACSACTCTSSTARP